MKVLITGGTGFVGKSLTRLLLNQDCQIISIARSARPTEYQSENLKHVVADTSVPGNWQDELQDVNVVVNLAGASIFRRWTKAYKELIYNSRILTTRNIVDALPANRNITLCSTSAVGYYGERGDDELDENDPMGVSFLSKVCRDWENEALKASKKNIRTAITRFGIVTDKSGGAIRLMTLPFHFFIGGPVGSGQQWFPWIHLSDLTAAFWYIIQHDDMNGVYNFSAPKPIRNVDSAKTIGNILKRPSFMKVPRFAVKLLMGEFGDAILASQRAIPKRLLLHGFQFQYADFESAMMEVTQVPDILKC